MHASHNERVAQCWCHILRYGYCHCATKKTKQMTTLLSLSHHEQKKHSKNWPQCISGRNKKDLWYDKTNDMIANHQTCSYMYNGAERMMHYDNVSSIHGCAIHCIPVYHTTELTILDSRYIQARTNKIHCPPTDLIKNWQTATQQKKQITVHLQWWIYNSSCRIR